MGYGEGTEQSASGSDWICSGGAIAGEFGGFGGFVIERGRGVWLGMVRGWNMGG